MMKYYGLYRFLPLVLLLIPLLAQGFEINTHQLITRCATSKQDCNRPGEQAKNLSVFAEKARLQGKSYEDEIFEDYGVPYFTYLEGTRPRGGRYEHGYGRYGIKAIDRSYLGLIEAGNILEDAVYSGTDPISAGGDGRFNNHFYAAQFDSRDKCTAVQRPLMKSKKALCVGYGQRTDSITWALDDQVKLAAEVVGDNVVFRKNHYTIQDAFRYFRGSFLGDTNGGDLGLAAKRKNQAALFVSLGSMIHIIQDLHSPGHVRDGSHPGGDYLEIFGRYGGGFNLYNGSYNNESNPQILAAVKSLDMKQSMLVDNAYSSYQDFFFKEADWVSKNFFNEAHPVRPALHTFNVDTETGKGLRFKWDGLLRGHTFFDGKNSHLDKSEVSEKFEQSLTHIDESSGLELYESWHYILSNGNVGIPNASNNLRQIGQQTANTVALKFTSNIASRSRSKYHMLGQLNDLASPEYAKGDYDTTPLLHTAINVIPRAVVSTEAFINYFFRGQMEAELTFEESGNDRIVSGLVIKNTSDPESVSSEDLLTFKAGSEIKVLYVEKDDVNEISHEILTTYLVLV